MCIRDRCRDDFTLKQLDKPAVTAVLREVTSADQGRAIRVVLEVGQAPAAKRTTPPAPAPKPASQPAPAPEEPPLPKEPPEPASAADTPPWVAPSPAPATGPDKMDELLHNGQQLDSFQIK